MRQCKLVVHSHGIDMDSSALHIFLLAKKKSIVSERNLAHSKVLGVSDIGKKNLKKIIETYPLSICFAILKPRARFSVKTALERPYSVSFAISIASSSLEISMMETEGPKDSV